MSRQRFINLAKDFCTLARLEQHELLLQGYAVEVEGIDFHLEYDEDTAPDHLMVYCDFGEAPAERLAESYAALLEANMVIYSQLAPTFMLAPDRRVALGYRYELAAMAPPLLLGLMVNLAQQAQQWRIDHFLAPETATP